MKRLVLTAAAALLLAAGIEPGYAQHRDVAHAAMPPVVEMHGSRTRDGHRHRVAAIVVFVPVFIGSAYAPYYYPTYYPSSAPAYVDEDPPIDVYQEPSGFAYYCANPAGYYPHVQDCPNGWRLVVP